MSLPAVYPVVSGGTLPISIVSGNVTINVTLPALQSGEEVVISGGQVALSGLIVEISGSVVNISGESVSVSGDYVNLASSGVIITNSSGYLNVNPQHVWSSWYTNSAFSGTSQGPGQSQLNIAAIIVSGTAAAQSGVVVELKRVDIAITGSGAGGQLVSIYRITYASGSTSGGDVFAPKPMFVNYSGTSIVNSLDSTAGAKLSGVLQDTLAQVQLNPTFLSGLTRENFVFQFTIKDGFQPPTIGSGYGVMVTMTSGVANGIYNIYWIEKYLS